MPIQQNARLACSVLVRRSIPAIPGMEQCSLASRICCDTNSGSACTALSLYRLRTVIISSHYTHHSPSLSEYRKHSTNHLDHSLERCRTGAQRGVLSMRAMRARQPGPPRACLRLRRYRLRRYRFLNRCLQSVRPVGTLLCSLLKYSLVLKDLTVGAKRFNFRC